MGRDPRKNVKLLKEKKALLKRNILCCMYLSVTVYYVLFYVMFSWYVHGTKSYRSSRHRSKRLRTEEDHAILEYFP